MTERPFCVTALLKISFPSASSSCALTFVPDVAPANERRDPGYGYQWWILDAESGYTRLFAGNGYGGQFVLVHPEHDIVAVFNGWNIHVGDYRSTYRALQERILPHVDPTQ